MLEEKDERTTRNTETTIGWVDKVGELLKKYGLQNIFLSVMVLFLVVVVGQMAFNPESVFKKVEESRQKAHTEAVQKRISNEPKIREYIVNLKNEVRADRVFVLETHNGGNNLSNLPFIYVDLTYAEPKGAMSWMESEYKNVRLSRYPWASEVYSNTYWSGTVESIERLDPELFHRLKSEDVVFLAAMMMYGTYNPSGCVGVVYTDEDIPSDDEIRRILMRYVGMLSPLFNNE